MLRAIAVVVMLSVGGCSLMLARGPRSDFDAHPELCTYSKNPVLLDYMFAGLLALPTLAVALAPSELSTGARVGVGVGGGAVIGLELLSAMIGKRRIERCRRAYGDYQVRHGGAIDGAVTP